MISDIRIAEAIRSRIGNIQPRIALVLGSGLSTVANIIEQPRIFAYDELEGFPRSTVPGHDGRLLIGPNDDSIGPRFVDMSDAWSAELRGRIHRVAHEEAIDLREGVYLIALGPNFETPAEVRAMAILGGDAVGMSTVPECLVARHCGMQVLGLSLITNLGAGLADQQTLDHEGTLAAGADASSRVTRLLRAFLPTIGIDLLNARCWLT